MSNQHTPGASWTDDEIATLKDMWSKGISGKDIAKELNRSRNSIMGKIDRMGLSKPGETRLPRPRYTPLIKTKRTLALRGLTGRYRRIEYTPPPNFETGNVPFRLVRGGQCRFIACGTAGLETLMCGEPVVQGSYCGFHHQLTTLKKNAPLLTRAVASAAVPEADPLVAQGPPR